MMELDWTRISRRWLVVVEGRDEVNSLISSLPVWHRVISSKLFISIRLLLIEDELEITIVRWGVKQKDGLFN